MDTIGPIQLPLTTTAFLVLYALGCLGALRKPLIGVITYMLVYFSYPDVAWWAKPVAWMGIRYSHVAAVCTAIGIFFTWRRLQSGRRFWHHQEILFAVLVGTMWVSIFTGAGPCETSYAQLDKMTKVLVFVLMMTHVVTDLRSYRLLIWTLIVGTFYLAYVSYSAGPHSFVNGRLNDIGGPDFDRAPELGIHFVAMLPFVGAVLLTDRRWHARIFLLITAVLTWNGIVLTRTRSAMTAIIAGMGWALVRTPRKWRTRLILLGTVGLIGGYSLTDEKFWERMSTIPTAIEEQSKEDRDVRGQVISAGRLPTWKASLAMWRANPLGVGIGNFTRMIEKYPPASFAIDAHNTIVLCFAELGIFGIAAFSAILLGTRLQFRCLSRVVAANAHLQWLKIDIFALETTILAFMVGAMTVSRLYCEMFWCLLALPICLERAVASHLSLAPSERQETIAACEPVGANHVERHSNPPGQSRANAARANPKFPLGMVR